jgi:hypothetical protein
MISPRSLANLTPFRPGQSGNPKGRAPGTKNRWKIAFQKDVGPRNRHRCSGSKFNQMLIAQDGRCAVCNAPLFRPNIDHDHVTGAVRELLCNRCNVFIGVLEGAGPELLRAIEEYRERHRNFPLRSEEVSAKTEVTHVR